MTHQDVIKLLELQRAVKELPSRYGFANLGDFIRALKEFDRAKSAASSNAETPLAHSLPAKTSEVNHSEPANNSRKGNRLNAETLAQIESLLNGGAKTREVVQKTGFSTATIHKIKKKLKLVKSRKVRPISATQVTVEEEIPKPLTNTISTTSKS